MESISVVGITNKLPNIAMRYMSTEKDNILAETILLDADLLGFVSQKVIHRQDCTETPKQK